MKYYTIILNIKIEGLYLFDDKGTLTSYNTTAIQSLYIIQLLEKILFFFMNKRIGPCSAQKV